MLELLPVPVIVIASLIYVFWRKAYISQILVIANILIFIYVVILREIDYTVFVSVYNDLSFRPDLIGDMARLPTFITSMFMHADFMHLAGNMLILYLIGLPLEERIGTKNWTIIYFTTGIVATLSFWALNVGVMTLLLGASGAIFGIGGAMLILYPKDRIPMVFGFMFTTNLPVWITVGFMFVFESVLVFYAGMDNIAHIAHAGGAISGIIIAPHLIKLSGHDKSVRLDFAALRKLASSEKELDLVGQMENEKIEDVRNAWLDDFLNNVKCGRCGSRLIREKKKMKCEGCGAEYRFYR